MHQGIIRQGGAINIIPRHICVPLKRYGHPEIQLKFFRIRFIRRSQTRLRSALQANLGTLNSKIITGRGPKHSEGSLVSPTYIVAIYAGVPKRTLCKTPTNFRERGKLVQEKFNQANTPRENEQDEFYLHPANYGHVIEMLRN